MVRYNTFMNNNHVTSSSSVGGDQSGALFDAGPFRPDAVVEDALGPGTPRLRRANRRQVEFRACAWNDLLPEGHSARIVWQFVEGLDLSPLLARIKSVEGRPGPRPSAANRRCKNAWPRPKPRSKR